jgi:hypothetical protein
MAKEGGRNWDHRSIMINWLVGKCPFAILIKQCLRWMSKVQFSKVMHQMAYSVARRWRDVPKEHLRYEQNILNAPTGTLFARFFYTNTNTCRQNSLSSLSFDITLHPPLFSLDSTFNFGLNLKKPLTSGWSINEQCILYILSLYVQNVNVCTM